MKAARYFLVLGLVVVLVSGCLPNFPQPASSMESTLEPTGLIPTEAIGPTALPGLTLDAIQNAEYILGDGSTRIALIDGRYEKISDQETMRISILERIAFGDLDGDGTEDAAVILVENYGGTGQFEYLVPVFNINGEAFPAQGYSLGDRVVVNSMNFEENRLLLDMLVHDPNDGLCCPSKPMVRSFEYYPGLGFKLVHVTSGAEGDGYRDIILDEPVRGITISSQFQVSGSFTISPFEATLVVKVVDMQDQILYVGPIMAPVDNLGDPGTFTDMVDMSSVNPPPGLVRIEVSEVSMADGSTLVMDSVLVILE